MKDVILSRGSNPQISQIAQIRDFSWAEPQLLISLSRGSKSRGSNPQISQIAQIRDFSWAEPQLLMSF